MVSLPIEEDRFQSNGLYYHVSFHDLQVSAKLVPLVSPELVEQQFRAIDQAGHIDLLLLNVGNIRPHVFNIELIGRLLGPAVEPSPDLVSEHYRAFTHRHFPGFESEVQALMERYYQAPFQFGEYPDEKAGEQIYHHTLRNCIKGVLKHESIIRLVQFIPNAPAENEACFHWLLARAEGSLPEWQSLHQDARVLYSTLAGGAAQYFADSIQMQIDYMYHSCSGFVHGLKGLLAYGESNYREAFCQFSHGKQLMEQAWQTLTSCEHDKWVHFYRGEWLTDTRETIRELETLRGLTKILGDTDTWRSRWMVDALRLRTRTIQTITQATTDYDRLASALGSPSTDNEEENLGILR